MNQDKDILSSPYHQLSGDESASKKSEKEVIKVQAENQEPDGKPSVMLQVILVEVIPIIIIGVYCYLVQSYFTAFLIVIEVWIVNMAIERFYNGYEASSDIEGARLSMLGKHAVFLKDFRKSKNQYIPFYFIPTS